MHPDESTRSVLVERRRVMLMVDLAGFTRAVAALSAMELAQLVDRFYCLAAEAVESAGGEVVKYVGDGCLAIFDEADAVAAVACARGLAGPVATLGRDFSIDLDVGANIHLSVVVEGEFGRWREPIARHHRTGRHPHVPHGSRSRRSHQRARLSQATE